MKWIQKTDRTEASMLEEALLERLGVDPAMVSADGVTAEYVGGSSPVVLRWSGVATMPVEEFEVLVEAAAPPRL